MPIALDGPDRSQGAAVAAQGVETFTAEQTQKNTVPFRSARELPLTTPEGDSQQRRP